MSAQDRPGGIPVWGWGGIALLVLTVIEVGNKRPLFDIIALVLMVLVVAGVPGVYLVRSHRGRIRSKAVREARWRPVLDYHDGQDAIVLTRSVFDPDGAERIIDGPRLFEPVPHGAIEGGWEAQVAEALGRAENRCTVLNATRR